MGRRSIYSFSIICSIVLVLSISSELFNTVEAKFSFSNFKSDLFSEAQSSQTLTLNSRRLNENDPCEEFGDGRPLPAGHPCSAKSNSFESVIPSLIGLLRRGDPSRGHHPPSVGHHNQHQGNLPPLEPSHPPGTGHHPPGVGDLPPGKGKQPPNKGNHPPCDGMHPPGAGHHLRHGVYGSHGCSRVGGNHPPGSGKLPPGVGHHPPGIGDHPPRFGHTCRTNISRCRDPLYNPELLADDTATSCCRARCRSLQNNPRHCGICGNRCTKKSGGAYCCSAICTDILTDKYNCGSCGNKCIGGSLCVAGSCTGYAV